MKIHWKVLLGVLLVLLVSTMAFSYERNETLVYGGGLWGAPTNWNPLTPWGEVTGTGGLVYEYLFHYYPLTDEYQPWLAVKGEWVTPKVYEVELRKGVKWTDGKSFTAEDVVFTFEVAKNNALHYSNVWEWIVSVEAVSPTKVKFVFGDEPHYQEWKNIIYDLRILPKHIWANMSPEEYLSTANANPVGTGPYMADSTGQDRMVWVRNDNWWGNDVFGQPKPKYLVNLVVNSNNVALGMLMKGELDLSNYFIPGVPKIKDTFGLTTWYKGKPYMLSENSALLFLNTTKGAMKDATFRKALAFAINPEIIVERVFENQVEVANPTGLFGEGWMKYYDETVAEAYGFSYDPKKAIEMLDENGFVDVNGDGWRDDKNGNAMKFEIIVPNGWTDWMESIKVIANNFQAIGINAVPSFPDYGIYMNRIQDGSFDMCINNFASSRSSTPFTYWNWVATDEIDGKLVTDGNYSRYDDDELFTLIDEFNRMQDTDKGIMEKASEIQKKLLTAMPSIPLWYNGLWAQSTSNVWTNWATEDNPTGYPCSWAGKMQFGFVEMLIELESAQ
jgi:peptide/nickel transport system substrate-binding protein